MRGVFSQNTHPRVTRPRSAVFTTFLFSAGAIADESAHNLGMRVFITGATGFVGRALVQRLLGTGHAVTALVRDSKRARDRLGPDVELCPVDSDWSPALTRCQAVVNLAGESVLRGAWTETRRIALGTSRVELTEKLCAAMAAATVTPRVLISASAVGYYGERKAEPLTESSGQGAGFLAEMCGAWEAAAQGATAHGVRVACIRIGIVLGLDGGALAAMLPAFKLGLGGPLGDGKQYLPWIHLDDLTAIIIRGLTDERMRGVFNGSAPTPVTSREFASALGRVLQRPAFLPVPVFALKVLLGPKRSQVPLQSQRARPAALEALHYRFRYTQLSAALAHLLASSTSVHVRRTTKGERTDLPKHASYVLEHRSRMHVPIAEAFQFFCKAQNLGLLTPSWMSFAMTSEPPSDMQEGSELNYRIALGPIPMRWKTIIRRWSPPHGFVDMQASGPYALWWHEHSLEAAGAGNETEMLDRVYYSPPLGPLGRLVHPILIKPMLRAIFAYRASATERLFGRKPDVSQLSN